MDQYTISCLGSNLSLLIKEEAAHNSSLLVPSPDASTLYERSSFIGRSWSFLYNLTDTLFGSELHNNKYIDTVTSTAESLKSCLVHISLLNDKITEARINNSVSPMMRKEVILFGEALSPFFSYSTSFLFQKKLSLIQSCFNRVIQNKIINKEETISLEKFGRNYAVVVIEGIIQRPIPISIFIKLLNKQSINYEEEYLIEKWIEAINRQEDHIPPWIFHLALQRVIEELNYQDLELNIEILCSLEELLLKRGLKVVEKDDPQVTNWAQHLIPGDYLDIDKEHILGAPIVHPLFPSLSLIAFENMKNPNEMFVIGRSFTTLGLWKKTSAECWAVPPVNILKIGEFGRYFVMEKLKLSLDERVPIKRFGSLAEEDKEPLKEIAKLVNWFFLERAAPDQLSTNELFFDFNNRIKTFTPLKKSYFNYETLENFCIASANGNYHALIFIMQNSKLFEHPVGRYYLDVIREDFLNIASFRPADEAAVRNIVDPAVIDRANKLIKDEKELVYKLFVKIYPMLKKKGEVEQNRLKKEIREAILQFHADAKIPASCWHESEKRIMDYIHLKLPELFLNKSTHEWKSFAPFIY